MSYWRDAVIALGQSVKMVIDNRHTPESIENLIDGIWDKIWLK